jgi:hypothetical protein
MSNQDFTEIKELAKKADELAVLANRQFTIELNTIVEGRIKDQKTIENLLDRMLDFAFNDDVLLLYKKLCRYYLPINPEATVSYIDAYRDLWDNDTEQKEDKNNE